MGEPGRVPPIRYSFLILNSHHLELIPLCLGFVGILVSQNPRILSLEGILKI